MKQIKILTDSGSDIGLIEAFDYGVEVLPATFVLNDKPSTQDIDFRQEDMYKWQEKGIRASSYNLPAAVYYDRFRDAFSAGIKDVIVISSGQNMASFYESALYAKKDFYEEHEDAEMNIEIIDSTVCSYPLGKLVLKAATMVKNDRSAKEIVDTLNDDILRVEMYITFLGTDGIVHDNLTSFLFDIATDLSKVAPIIRVTGGKVRVLDAQWRNQDLISRFLQYIRRTLTVKNAPYDILYAAREDNAKEFSAAIEAAVGYAPRAIVQVGTLAVARFGFDFVAVSFEGEKRPIEDERSGE